MTFRPVFARSLYPVLCLALIPTAALTDPVDTQTARAMLYRDDRVEVARYQTPGLDDAQVKMLTTVAQTQRYYAAIAFAPDQGILAEPTVMSANYHTIEAARAAAMDECNARRSGGARCVIAMEVRPQGWEAQDLQLSADATEAFNDSYRRERGTRAFAISASSGQWGIGLGDDAEEDALTACQGDTEVSDCSIVIAD